MAQQINPFQFHRRTTTGQFSWVRFNERGRTGVEKGVGSAGKGSIVESGGAFNSETHSLSTVFQDSNVFVTLQRVETQHFYVTYIFYNMHTIVVRIDVWHTLVLTVSQILSISMALLFWMSSKSIMSPYLLPSVQLIKGGQSRLYVFRVKVNFNFIFVIQSPHNWCNSILLTYGSITGVICSGKLLQIISIIIDQPLWIVFDIQYRIWGKMVFEIRYSYLSSCYMLATETFSVHDGGLWRTLLTKW